MLSTTQTGQQLEGRVIAPDHPDYDEARTVFYGDIDRRPALIARAANAQDVARVIELAREDGLELAVRSGGHSTAGHGVSEGGVVVDLSELKGLEVDVNQRTAWAEAGLTAGEYTLATATSGLATGFGDTGSVGIGGITLAGGVGFLVRKYGLTIDNVLAAEVVTADGEIKHADAETNPDLFWALRGGGGNFGVVTRLKFRLHEVGTIVGGMLILPATPEVIEAFVAEALAAPDELSTIANILRAPPLPFLPPEAHGRPIVMGLMAYAGEARESERVLAPFRALAEPIADMLRPMAYPEVFPPEPEGAHPVVSTRNMLLDRFDRREAEAVLERLETATAPLAATQVRALGGAMARVPQDATAFAHRQSPIMANVAAMYQDPGERQANDAWVAGLAAELDRGDERAYAGFLGDEGEERVRAAYPEATWARLAAVKAEYDPDNVFQLNQNIPPG